MPEAPAGTLALSFLGSPQVTVCGDLAWRFVPKRKALELLAYLALNAKAAVGRDTVAFALWPDDDEEASRANLRRNLHILTQLLPSGGTWVVADPDTLLWNPAAPTWCDVVAFRAASDRSDFAAAAELYRGEFLTGYYDEWILQERERLVRTYHDALTKLVRDHRTQRRFEPAISFALRLLDEDPWREDVVRHVIAIRYEAGDRAAALRTYDAFAERLRTEMNVEPMPETQALRDAILHSRATRDETAAAVESIAPSVPQPAWTLPFVGRQRELEALHGAWNRAATGSGSIVFVHGEAGIGKSSLVRAFAAHVVDEGGRVLLGATSSPERFAYQAVLDAFAGAPSLIAACGVPPAALEEVGTLLPELRPPERPGSRKDAGRLHGVLEPERERSRLFEAMARVIEALATSRPLVLVVEDVHWAGPATLSLLSYFSTRLTRAQVLIIVTYRDEDALRGHPIHGLRRELASRSRATTLALAWLSRADIDEVVAQVPELTSAADGDIWYERCAGNPLFLSELVRDALERGGTAASLPAHVAGTITGRLDRLSEESRATADLAAVMGDVVDFEVISSASGRDENQIMDALAELLDRRILRETFDRARLRYAFTHNVVRQTVYDAIPAARRRAYHGVLARVLESTFPDRLDDYAADIAGHYDADAEFEAAAAWHLRAARAALRVYANADAVERASLALAHATDQLKLEALLVRATALERLGEQARETEDLLALKAMATKRGDSAVSFDALERLIKSHMDAGRLEQVSSSLAELRAIMPADDRLRSAVADELAGLLAYNEDEYVVADEYLERAARSYHEEADPRELRVLCQIAVSMRRRGNFEGATSVLQQAGEALAAVDEPLLRLHFLRAKILVSSAQQEPWTTQKEAEQTLRLALQIGDRRCEADAHHYLGLVGGKLRKFDDAEQHFAAAIAVNQLIGERSATATVLRNYAGLQMDRCRFARALELLDAAKPLTEEKFHVALCEYNAMACLMNLGNLHDAIAAGERAHAAASEVGHVALCGGALVVIGACLLHIGNVPAARAKLEEGTHILRSQQIRSHLGDALGHLIDVYLAQGAVQQAGAVASEVLALRESGAEFFETARVLWAVARSLTANGDAAGARAAMEQADREVEAMLDALGKESPEAESFAQQPWCEALRNANRADRRAATANVADRAT